MAVEDLCVVCDYGVLPNVLRSSVAALKQLCYATRASLSRRLTHTSERKTFKTVFSWIISLLHNLDVPDWLSRSQDVLQMMTIYQTTWPVKK